MPFSSTTLVSISCWCSSSFRSDMFCCCWRSANSWDVLETLTGHTSRTCRNSFRAFRNAPDNRSRFRFVFERGRGVQNVRGNRTGDQTRAAAEGQILNPPTDEHDNPALELDQVHQVNEKPNPPGNPAGEVPTEDVGHRGAPADYGHV